MTRWLAIVLSFAATSTLLWGGGKKSSSHVFTCHMESSADEAPKFAVPIKLGTEMRQYYFKKVPSITDEDVSYFYPFISEDGATFGVGFKLTEYASEGLKALTLTNQGKLLGIRVPNAPYSAVMIDRPVEDGVIVIWSGLSKAHLKAFEKKFPHVEQINPAETGGPPPVDPGAISLPLR